jgi:probable phosphoglycerate mutase
MTEHSRSAVYLIRHGQTEWSKTGQHTGATDIPLTAEGEQQARRAAGVLSALRATSVPPALVLSSPRIRALRTAELVGLNVDKTTEDLREWDYGDYEGLTTQQIREKVPQWTVWSHPVPGGETAEQVDLRAKSVVDTVRAALPKGDVVLIGHGHFSRVLVTAWLNLRPEDGVRFAVQPAAVSVLGFERDVPRLNALNVPPITTDD